MSANIQQAPYLPQQRQFPADSVMDLSIQVNRAYVDIAQKMNARTIGVYSLGNPIITGNVWHLQGSNKSQQTLRQIYTFNGSGNISHGIATENIAGFVHIYGTFTDGTIWYPLPYVNVASATNQVSVTVTATNIVITSGAGSPPTISSGYVVLEWLSLI